MNSRNSSTRTQRWTRWCKAGLLGAAFALVGTQLNAQVTVTGASAGVNAGSPYATLGAAFTAINGAAQTGNNIVISITGNTTESASAVLNAGAWTSVTIQPSGGAARTIQGSIAGAPLVDLNGADNVTIDGLNTGGNSLTIDNPSTSSTSGTSTIRFQTDATGNTVNRCSVLGSATISVSGGTNGGNIWFGAGAVTTGNDNNTISNCNIGPSGSNLPMRLIWGNGSTTSTALENSGITISGNNLFDFFSATAVSRGIDVITGNTGWTIQNNRIYQTATRTFTTGALMRAISIVNTSTTAIGTGFTVSGNTIGFANSAGTGTWTVTGSTNSFHGVFLSATTAGIPASSVQGNTIAGINITTTGTGTSSSAPFIGLMLNNGVINCGNVTGNTIGSQSATGSIVFNNGSTSFVELYAIQQFSLDPSIISNNLIGGITGNATSTGTVGIIGIRNNTSTTVATTIQNNTVGGSVANSIQSIVTTGTTTSSVFRGIENLNAIGTITGNTVRNATVANGTGTTTAASAIGILITTSSTNQTVGSNTIFNLSNSNTTAATIVTGIQFTGSTANVVERNLIYGLTSATNNASAEVNGIRVAGGTTTYRNNMIALGAGISNAIGSAASNSGTSGINGINEALGTDNFYHNSVYIGGTATAGTGASYAFNGTQTVNTRAFRDNIFQNARTNSGATGSHYAVKVNGTVANPAGLTINNNVYFANGASGAVFGFFNGANVANIGAWRTAVGQDAGSFESNPQFNDPTNSTPDLHLHPTNATIAEGNGVDVGVTNDYDGQTRASFTPVDIGADAGNYSGLDLSGPVISYTALTNTLSTADRTQSITVTDVSNAPIAGIGLPVIYYRKNAGAYVSNQCVWTGGSGYDCTINNALVGGVVASDIIDYYVVAQDAAPIPNVSSNPSTGALALTANPPAAGTPTTTPNSYAISVAISGNINVGVGETFTSLTRNDAAGVFRYLNNNLVSGDVTITLTSDLTLEDGAVALNAFASPFNVTVKPGGAPRAITGSIAANALIRTNGASRFTIDGSTSGGTDRSLTITNTSVTTPQVVRFSAISPASITALTLKNCIIRNGVNTSSAVILTDNAGAAQNFTNITIQNNDIGLAFIGVFANATVSAGNGSGLLITQNTLTNSGANAIRNTGIYVQGVDGATISNNTVSNLETTSSENKTGIWLATGTSNTTVSGNTVSNISLATAAAFVVWGIRESSGVTVSNNTITSNTISSLSSNGNTNVAVFGIDVTGGSTVIQRNNVSGVNAINTGTFGANGICITSGNNSIVRNNFVSNITGDITGGAAFSTTFGIFGIRVVAGTGQSILNNSVNLYGLRAGTANSSLLTAALGIVTTASTGLDIRNNILANNITGGTTSVANVAIYLPSGATAAMNALINNNSYYRGTDVARAGVGQAGTTAGTNFFTTLPALVAYTSTLGNATNDNASITSTGAVPYVSNTDLHIGITAPEYNTGATIASVTNDFDGDTRPQNGTYDIGADEAVIPACSGTPIAGTTTTTTPSICAGQTVSMTNNALNAVSGIAYQWQVSSTPGGPYSNVTGGTGATTQSYSNNALAAGTYYFVLRITCTNTSQFILSNEVTVVVNPTPTSVPTSNSPVCTGGTINLNGGTDSGTTFTWSGPNSYSSSSQNNTIPSAALANAGTYTLIVSNGSCSSTATTTVSVDVIPPTPTITPGGPTTFCQGGSVALSASGSDLSGVATQTSGTISVAIPDVNATGINNAFSVSGIPGGATIDSVIVTLNITHSFVEDLIVNLEAPNGQIINLAGGVAGATGSAYTGTRISSNDARPALLGATTGHAGTYRADKRTTGFQLTPATVPTTAAWNSLYSVPNGTWRIRVIDDESIGTGTLTNWQIKIAYSLPVVYTWSPGTGLNTTNGPSVIASPSAPGQTYTVTAANSNNNACTSINTVAVTVNPLPTVVCPADFSVCSNDAIFALSGATPAGGTYSGVGVSGGNFDPSSGNGPHVITYSYTDGNTCTNTCQFTITVNAPPVVTCPANNSVCIDVPAYALSGGSPVGGTYSGTGVSGGNFDPATAGAGTHTITYSYTDGNSCTNTCQFTITVNPLPVVTCGGPYGPVCINGGTISLSGSPAGGTWSGTGVTGSTFDPGVSGAGSFTLTYSYTDGNGCSNSCTTSITVNPLPVVICPANTSGICSNDAAFALGGGSPAGGTYSGTGVSGGNFDPAVAGAGTHTITYSYTDGNGCSNSCQFTITVTAATTWYQDQDNDTFGDPANFLLACTPPVGYVANNTDNCPTTFGVIGSACNDGNPFTTADVLQNDCSCAGTPVPCDNWTLTINTDGAGNETTWQIIDATSPYVLASGGPYTNNSSNVETICVPQGACFNLTFNDAGNNGMSSGGWLLVDNNGRRILDNVNNGACFLSTGTTAEPFCNEPASAQSLIATQCDKENWLPTDVIIASANAAVSAQWGIGDQTDDGYQFWFQNPCGGYTRKIFRNHATSGGNGPANALRATKLALSTIVSNPLPVGTLLNVRVRTRVNGVNGTWGPVCRFRIDPNACTLTKLNDIISDPHFSCGATGKVVNAGGDAGKIFAKVVTSGGNPATNYRFEISNTSQSYLRYATSTNAALVLGQWATNPLLCGTWTYDVRVQASFDGGNSYCPYGDVCTVTITNNLTGALCTAQVAFTGNGGHAMVPGNGVDMSMYPNPNRGEQLFINLRGFSEDVNEVGVEIYDGFGKRVVNSMVPAQDGYMNTTLELDRDFAAGIYMVHITAGELVRTERLVIQR